MDHGFVKPKEQWEMSDGSIFLLRECSKVDFMHDLVIKNLDNLSNLCFIDTFKHSNVMRQNLFKSLAKILTQMGKKKFRAYIELFIDPTFRVARSLDNSEANMNISAQDFIITMEKSYGENIFRAIVEGHDDKLLPALQSIKEEGQRQVPTDFIYPGFNHQPPSAFGLGSGKGPVAGQLNIEDSDLMMTKAPWAK